MNLNLIDHQTGEEITGVDFPDIPCRPMPGDRLHYWIDHGHGDPTGRRNFHVMRVEHDMRYFPRGHQHAYTLVLYVSEV